MLKYCKKCQAETDRNACGRCKPCANAANATYRAANPEKVEASRAAWIEANPEKERARYASYRAANSEKRKAYSAAHRAANPDKLKAYKAAYSAANKDKTKASSAAYRAANQDKRKAACTAWAKANLELRRIYDQNYRARKCENGGKLSKGLANKLFVVQKGKCACCGEPLGDNYHLDHIMPLVLGGSNTDDNIQLLRQRCNSRKSAKHPIDYMQQQGFLL